MSAHVFQVGDRFLETAKYGETWTGTITEIQPVGDETAYAYAWRDDDPEHSRGQRVVALTVDLTGSRYARVEHVELWDGGINGVSTGVDEYRCSEPGCTYHVLAAGPQDPDEPDYYAEGIEEHERGHAARPFQVGDEIRVTPRSQDDISGLWTITEIRPVVETGNLIADLTAIGGTLRGVIILNPDGTDAARGGYTVELLRSNPSGDAATSVDEIRDSGIDDDLAAPVPYIPTDPLPALVQLDQAEAHAEARLIKAALAWATSEYGIPWDHTAAQDELRAASHDYRKVTNR